MLHDFVPLVGLAFEPRKSHLDKGQRSHHSSQPLAWFPITPSSPAAPVLRRSSSSSLNPETPAFEPLSPPYDNLECFPSGSPVIPIEQDSPNRRRTLDLPPSPPDSPPREGHEEFEPPTAAPQLAFARPRNKASRGRAPTRSSSDSTSRTRSTASGRRSRTPTSAVRSSPRCTPTCHLPTPEPETIFEEDAQDEFDERTDERFLSLPLLRLRHRLAVTLTLSNYTNLPRAPYPSSSLRSSPSPDLTRSLASLPVDGSVIHPHRRRRSFPPGTVWAEQSHYRLYALQRSKANRTVGGIGYWKRWEGIDLE